MTMFGLKEAEVAVLVRAVTRDDLDTEGIERGFARATWTGMAEPGDGAAGALIAAIGPVAALAAVLEHRTPVDLAAATGIDAAVLAPALARWSPRMSSADALLSLRQAARYGVRLRTPDDDDWHRPFDDLGQHAPIALWTRGQDAALTALSDSIALVGARAATGYGEHVTMECSAGLVDRGFAIVSGAAYGIDGMAHRAALASHGSTVAFLAGGVDRFYPSGHDALLTRIVAEGCVVSELPCGSPPTKWRFLQRNRLIAAASLATIVLEAGTRSGALNTAHHAAELGRPIGAVPGPVTSPASAGCHRLLRESDAVCVTGPDEMAELARPGMDHALGIEPGTGGAARNPDPITTRLLDALSMRGGRALDEIAKRAGLSISTTASALARLELDGLVREGEKGWQQVTRR